ncbi:MAG TPA: hypothetical protein VGM56_30925 [Byssovorax sp.]
MPDPPESAPPDPLAPPSLVTVVVQVDGDVDVLHTHAVQPSDEHDVNPSHEPQTVHDMVIVLQLEVTVQLWMVHDVAGFAHPGAALQPVSAPVSTVDEHACPVTPPITPIKIAASSFFIRPA